MAINKKIIGIALATGLAGFVVGHNTGRNEAPSVNSVLHRPDHLPSSPLPAQTYYVCPMHPEVVSDEPGDCPICGMALVKKNGTHEAGHNHGDYPAVSVAPAVLHNLGVRTAQAVTGEMQRHIETIGKITRVDQSAKRIITPPINGQLVYIADKYEGDEVEQGELLFTLSSPELFELERRFQEAALAGDQASASAMFTELSQKGLNLEQISKLQTGETTEFPVEVYAQEQGYVFARRGQVGETVRTGFTVFNLGGNYRVVEVTAEIFERQWGWVEADQPARMSVRGLPGLFFEG
ncbi:MAG: efflux RND transporter periplasmic adaptor subunit, partial [Gammaproteobacteria bacterium]